MKFRLIPPGEFLMGASEEEIADMLARTRQDEYRISTIKSSGPQRRVQIQEPFYLGVTEVTQEQHREITGEDRSAFSATGARAAFVEGRNTGKFPVDSIDWFSAVAYCNRLSVKEGLQAAYEKSINKPANGYRLPRDAEWEYACRAGAESVFPFGEDAAELKSYAHYNLQRVERVAPTTVAQLRPNAWGFYDMLGNISEWCEELHELGWERRHRIIRGGAFHVDDLQARPSRRDYWTDGSRSENGGMRIVLPISDELRNKLKAGDFRAVVQTPPRAALGFDGKTAYADVLLPRERKLPKATLEAWVTPADAGQSTILSVIGSKDHFLALQILASRSFALQLVSGGTGHVCSEHAIVDRRPTHLAAVVAAGSMRLYVDGVQSATALLPEDFELPVSRFELSHQYEDRLRFRGQIDEFRISTIARYDQDFTPQRRFEADEDTLALYHFDEGQGDVLVDSSAGGQHGKIHGAKWVRAEK